MKTYFATAGFLLLTLLSNAQQIGDYGTTFDTSKFDSNYPQMSKWIQAGVTNGIPLLQNFKPNLVFSGTKKKGTLNTSLRGVTTAIKYVVLEPSNSEKINDAIIEVSKNSEMGAVFLRNGKYNINDEVQLKSNVVIIGEDRYKTICEIATSMTKNTGAFEFKKINNAGIYRLTIQGGWGTPEYNWNIGSTKNNELDGNENISVFMKNNTNCWLDDMEILNSADFPVRANTTHATFRNLHVDGVFNKHQGAHGYFFILNASNLITRCKITHLRHISLQGDGVEYNVVYDNDFQQEVSFHSNDDGNNLIENNRITLPKDMPSKNPDYWSIMGPWSTEHKISKKKNYLYKNECLELNHNGNTPYNDPDVVYQGPFFISGRGKSPADNFTPLPKNKTPKFETLYPIQLKDTNPLSSSLHNGNKKNTSFNLYPNPASDSIYFENFENTKGGTIMIYDMSGSLIKSLETSNKTNIIPVKDLNKGTYLLKFTNSKRNTTFTKHLVIN